MHETFDHNLQHFSNTPNSLVTTNIIRCLACGLDNKYSPDCLGYGKLPIPVYNQKNLFTFLRRLCLLEPLQTEGHMSARTTYNSTSYDFFIALSGFMPSQPQPLLLFFHQHAHTCLRHIDSYGIFVFVCDLGSDTVIKDIDTVSQEFKVIGPQVALFGIKF